MARPQPSGSAENGHPAQGRSWTWSGLAQHALLRLAYANVVITLQAVGFAYVALHAAGVQSELLSLAAPACAIFSVYTFDRILGADPQDAVNDTERASFIQRYRWMLLIAALGALAAGAGLVVTSGSTTAIALFFVPVAAGVLYVTPLLPRTCRYRRLKELPGAKSFIVSLAWGAGVALLPLVLADTPDWRPCALMALWVASRIFISATLFDVGDLAGDLQSKLPTLPVLLGRRRALRLLDFVNLGSAPIILSGSAVGLLPPSLSAMALAVSIYGAWFIHRVRTGRQIGFTCDVIVDSEGVFAAATLLGAALLIP